MPGPNHISQQYLKVLIDDDKCITNFMNITNVCINLGYWPTHFKRSTLTIISKPNKMAYNSPKAF